MLVRPTPHCRYLSLAQVQEGFFVSTHCVFVWLGLTIFVGLILVFEVLWLDLMWGKEVDSNR